MHELSARARYIFTLIIDTIYIDKGLKVSILASGIGWLTPFDTIPWEGGHTTTEISLNSREKFTELWILSLKGRSLLQG